MYLTICLIDKISKLNVYFLLNIHFSWYTLGLLFTHLKEEQCLSNGVRYPKGTIIGASLNHQKVNVTIRVN